MNFPESNSGTLRSSQWLVTDSSGLIQKRRNIVVINLPEGGRKTRPWRQRKKTQKTLALRPKGNEPWISKVTTWNLTQAQRLWKGILKTSNNTGIQKSFHFLFTKATWNIPFLLKKKLKFHRSYIKTQVYNANWFWFYRCLTF